MVKDHLDNEIKEEAMPSLSNYQQVILLYAPSHT